MSIAKICATQDGVRGLWAGIPGCAATAKACQSACRPQHKQRFAAASARIHQVSLPLGLALSQWSCFSIWLLVLAAASTLLWPSKV